MDRYIYTCACIHTCTHTRTHRMSIDSGYRYIYTYACIHTCTHTHTPYVHRLGLTLLPLSRCLGRGRSGDRRSPISRRRAPAARRPASQPQPHRPKLCRGTLPPSGIVWLPPFGIIPPIFSAASAAPPRRPFRRAPSPRRRPIRTAGIPWRRTAPSGTPAEVPPSGIRTPAVPPSGTPTPAVPHRRLALSAMAAVAAEAVALSRGFAIHAAAGFQRGGSLAQPAPAQVHYSTARSSISVYLSISIYLFIAICCIIYSICVNMYIYMLYNIYIHIYIFAYGDVGRLTQPDPPK